MPRTPLFRTLVHHLREHRLAAREGVPVDAIRERLHEARAQAARSGLSRRRFLAGAAGVVGGVALAQCGGGSRQPRIAIVGAGVAGLTTALRLADAGVAATVYEASGRVGGRMFSNTSYFDEG
ncbi:MAG TPA: FAD-dependent oxidoreductase [Polyangia bacterium]|jgi:monoamine oxidase|nr:FAD-dependent oxidoreductase [Polyangia bacterium]